MQKPSSAYIGDEQFAFVCYSHQDAKHVYPDIIALQEQALRLWYDEGIAAGSTWRGEIANAIKQCSAFVFFISRHSLASEHCLREVDYAININKKVVPVYLENIALPPDLELSLNRIQAISRHKNTDYLRHLASALSAQHSKPNGAASLSESSRSQQAKNRLAAKWGIAALAVLLIVGGLAYVSGMRAPTELSNETESLSANSADTARQAAALLSRWDKSENIASAISLLKKALEKHEDFVLGHVLLAEAFRIQYALTGDKSFIDSATSHTNKALKLDSNFAAAYVTSARVNLTQGNTDKAFSAANKALQIDPVNASANQAIALVHQRQSRFDEAKQYFEKAVLLAPDNIVILDSYANFLFDLGDYAAALPLWEKVLAIAPDHYAVLVNKGSALSELNRQQEAIEAFEQALSIKPSYAVYVNLGTAYDRTNKLQKAVDTYLKALEIVNDDWLVWGNLASAMERLNGMTEKTLSAYQQAISLAEKERERDQRNVWAHMDLALYYAHIQEITLAIDRLNTAFVLAPDMAEILVVAAQVYQKAGDSEAASDYIARALEQDYPINKIKQIDVLKPLMANNS